MPGSYAMVLRSAVHINPQDDDPRHQAPPDQYQLGYLLILVIGPTGKLGRYRADTEYYYDRGVAMPAGDLTLSVTDISRYVEADLDHLASDYIQRFTHARVVSPSDWIDVSVTSHAPTDTTGTARLYRVADPDLGAASIGILTDQAEAARNNALRSFTWYKTFRPTNGQVWTTPPLMSSPATLVRDVAFRPSTEIVNVSPAAASWYCIAQR